MNRAQVGANLATLANGLVGVGAILYTLAGNKLWAMLLITSGVGFDGLDGWLSRRGGPHGNGRVGRIADSVADAVTFGLAPATLLLVHTDSSMSWQPWYPWTLLVAVGLAGLAVGRLVYFTARSYAHPYFVGAPTPQTALALVAVVLFFDVPAFLGVHPLIVLSGAAVLAALMVAPVRFPKIRRGAVLRPAMTATGVALVVALTIVQFRPSAGSWPYDVSFAGTIVAAAGLLVYYLGGPRTVPPDSPNAKSGTA